MTEITFKIKDDLVKDYGEIFIKSFVEKQMEYLKLIQAMNKIEEEINASKMDYDGELETIREKAWKEYKKDFLN